MSHEVFISYSSKDIKIAETVLNFLESENIVCWMAPRNILPGADWPGSITDAIAQSKVMVLLASANSNISGHVKREVLGAISNEVIVIPLLIENVPLSSSLTYLLSINQSIEAWFPPIEQHLHHLAADLKALLNDGPPAVPNSALLTDKIFEEAIQALFDRDAGRALVCLNRVGEKIDRCRTVRRRLLISLTIVAGRPLNRLPTNDITRVETELIPIMNELDCSPLPMIIIAGLEIDYYRYQGQVGPSGIRAAETRDRLHSLELTEQDLKLLELIQLSDRANNFLNLGRRPISSL